MSAGTLEKATPDKARQERALAKKAEREHRKGAEGGGPPARRYPVPPALLDDPGGNADSLGEEEIRRRLVDAGHCRAGKPAVMLELYGGLRLKTGCDLLPLRAGTVAEAVAVLRRVYPKADAWLPGAEELGEHYRFSINGRTVTGDPSRSLRENDHLILFSASVGG